MATQRCLVNHSRAILLSGRGYIRQRCQAAEAQCQQRASLSRGSVCRAAVQSGHNNGQLRVLRPRAPAAAESLSANSQACGRISLCCAVMTAAADVL